MKTEENKKRQYFIDLEETRSVVALAASLLVFGCTMAAVAIKLQAPANAVENRLHYFTVWSNLLSAVGAAFMIPYAVEGIRKKRFSLPWWIVLVQYSGALCVAITMVTTLLLILPTQGISAVQGTDFWLHLVSPLSTVILFQCVETGISLRRRDMALALIPFWLYAATYYVMVAVIGKENGGWGDFYMTLRYCPAWVSIILMLTIGWGVAIALRRIQNWRAEQSRKRLTQLWPQDMDPAELGIEAFGLGRYMGKHCDIHDLTIPMDIFLMMEERYGVPANKLARAFVRGAVDAIQGKGEG